MAESKDDATTPRDSAAAGGGGVGGVGGGIARAASLQLQMPPPLVRKPSPADITVEDVMRECLPGTPDDMSLWHHGALGILIAIIACGAQSCMRRSCRALRSSSPAAAAAAEAAARP